MTEREPTDERDCKGLDELFVRVTGESVVTERQDREAHKKVIDPAESDSSPGEQRVDGAPAANGLEDAFGNRRSE